MKKHLLFKSLLLLFALVVGSSSVWAQTTVKDELTASDFAATSTTYTDFSGVSKTSDAVYAGNSDVTLYAQWTLSDCTITFNPLGGTPVPSQTVKL